jgi:uncharacterized protein (DUF1015 family)
MDSGAAVIPPHVAGPLTLTPFRGLGFSPARVGDPASARAFARPFRDVVERLDRWAQQGHVWHDDEPALYLHEYSTGGLTVRGLVGALDLSRRAHRPEERVILPHEGVHPAQADDLADRMTLMQLNPAPILLVHRGPTAVREALHVVAAEEPTRAFTDRGEQRHRIWTIREPDVVAAVVEGLQASRAVVADGHHRYAAYLRMQQQAPGSPCDRGLAMLVDQDDTPLFLGAIHRFLPDVTFDDLAAAAAPAGDVAVMPEAAALAALGPRTLVLTDGSRWGTVHLRVDEADRTAVELVHHAVIPALSQVPALSYHHSVEDTLDRVASTRGTALLMPAPEFDAVRRVVARDHLLPEKATSFQPKPSLGVLMRSLRDE